MDVRRILVIEDEEPIANGLKFNFEIDGYKVDVCGDGRVGLDRFRTAKEPFHLVIMDLMLPGMSGYEACQEIRKIDEQVPILVLSARTLSEDKAMAFDCGTDQYMTKPFALPELLSRARNLIDRHCRRRESTAASVPAATLAIGRAQINFKTFEARVGDTVHSLTTMEQQLLRYFIEHDGEVLSRARMMRDVWGETADITTRSIDNFVLRLRKIIEIDPASPAHILSVRGTGYRFLSHPPGST